MTYAAAVTDVDWFTFLRALRADEVNFWTPVPWGRTKLEKGDFFHFVLKGSLPRKVGGRARFIDYSELRVSEAWRAFGTRNGIASKAALGRTLRAMDAGKAITDADPVIGCIRLNRAEFWPDGNLLTTEESGFAFPRQVARLKYYPGEPSARPEVAAPRRAKAKAPPAAAAGRAERSLPVRIQAPDTPTIIYSDHRGEQGAIRAALLGSQATATCDVCGRLLPTDLLVVAHIKPRARCSDSERHDWQNNVMRACILGCDELFRRHFIAVRDGWVVEGSRKATTAALEQAVRWLTGKPYAAWNEDSSPYFFWHARSEAPEGTE